MSRPFALHRIEMLWLTVCCAALALAGASQKRDFAEKVREYKASAQSHYMDHLEQRINAYVDEVEHLQRQPEEMAEINHELHARLDHLEEPDCPENYYICGRGSKQCLHELLFCDGHNDCHNDADEDEEYCEGHIVRPGSSFHGLPTWFGCEQHHGQLMGFNLVQREIVQEHGSKIKVEGVVYWSPEDHEYAHGYWSPGSEKLLLDIKGDHMYLLCQFITDDLADCQMKRSKDEICATVRVRRS